MTIRRGGAALFDRSVFAARYVLFAVGFDPGVPTLL
jgi:hypothetical protein